MAIEKINSPMTGRVIEISVRVGDQVSEGDLLLVIESMKMENEVFSEHNGKVSQILITDDQPVSEEALLMEIETD